MYLSSTDILECQLVAERIASFVEDAPSHADGFGNPSFKQGPWTVCGASVSLSKFGKVSSIDEITASGNSKQIILHGLVDKADVDNAGDVLPHLQRSFVEGEGKRLAFVAYLAGVLAHEGEHALQQGSPSHDQTMWKDAQKLSQETLSTKNARDYETYVDHPYELAAHACQAVAEMLVTFGEHGLQDQANFKGRFRDLRVVRRIGARLGTPIEATASGTLIDRLEEEALRVVDHAFPKV